MRACDGRDGAKARSNCAKRCSVALLIAPSPSAGPPRPSHRGVRPRACRRFPSSERSEEHTSELQSRQYLVCRLLLEKKSRTPYQRRLFFYLDLFRFHHDAPAAPFCAPKGHLLSRTLEDAMRDLQYRRRSFAVRTPIV